jgi:acetyltransferase-like isoleucine patch superfamily enzyme
MGLAGPVLLTTMGAGEIVIGDHFGGSAVVISSRASVRIGDHVTVGGNVRIFDHDFHSLDHELRRSGQDCEQCASRPVTIGNDVFVGAHSIILKGVKLGDRVIVGAGSVVTKSFPHDSIIAGNPARLIGTVRCCEAKDEQGSTAPA